MLLLVREITSTSGRPEHNIIAANESKSVLTSPFNTSAAFRRDSPLKQAVNRPWAKVELNDTIGAKRPRRFKFLLANKQRASRWSKTHHRNGTRCKRCKHSVMAAYCSQMKKEIARKCEVYENYFGGGIHKHDRTTLVTQLTRERFERLQLLAQHWRGKYRARNIR